MTDYLTLVEVKAIHADQIARYGGAQGIRDEALLDAAVQRPQTGYYADVLEEAAALWESLRQNHAFVDGNKRTAFASRDRIDLPSAARRHCELGPAFADPEG